MRTALVSGLLLLFFVHYYTGFFGELWFLFPLFPLVYIIGIFSWLYSLLKKQRRQYVMLVALILSAFPLSNNLSYGSTPIDNATVDTQLGSYNVRLFNKYRWLRDFQDTEKPILQFFDQQQVDILCLQEVPKLHNTTQYLYKYSIQSEAFPYLRTLSQYPIIASSNLTLPGKSTSALRVRLDIKGKSLEVINIHLESVQSINRSLLKQKYTRSEFLSDSIFPRLIAQINPNVPTVLCGDFNTTPNSYFYRQLTADFSDAFFKSALNYGTTYYLDPLPIPVRIDYIWGSESVRFSDFKTHTVPYSDHLPITTRIHL